jgi:deoxyribose-phosphate aldolase
MDITRERMLAMMDVAMLDPTTTETQVRGLAEAAIAEGYGFVCVHSLHIRPCAEVLRGARPRIVGCVGFPMGIVRSEIKAAEAERAIEDGAAELDMVINVGALIGGDLDFVRRDIAAVVTAAGGAPVKVIIETPYLSATQKADASRLVQDSGAAFVKTCSGTSPDPIALYEDIRLIRRTVGPRMGIKASGRVGNYFRFLNMLEAGADRVGLVLEQAREILRGREEASRDRT